MQNQSFMRAGEVAQELHLKSHAYKVIHGLNEELQERISDHLRPCQSRISSGVTLLHQNSKGGINGSLQGRKLNWRQFITIPIGMVSETADPKRGFKTKREAQAWEREQIHKNQC